MSDDKQAIRDKIRKCRAVANNDGATEDEASTAMSMATALMKKYQIEQDELGEATTKHTLDHTYYRFPEVQQLWVLRAAQAAGVLATVNIAFEGSTSFEVTGIIFTGRAESRFMAQEMTLYLIKCVEEQYKINLKNYRAVLQDYLPKEQVSMRAEFRKTFKYACATRLLHRAREIVERLKTNDQAAQHATGKNALVVVKSIESQISEIADYMKQTGFETETVVHKKPVGSGSRAGYEAGNAIKINQEVGNG